MKTDRQAWQAVARSWKELAAREAEAGNDRRAESCQRAGDNATKKANAK